MKKYILAIALFHLMSANAFAGNKDDTCKAYRDAAAQSCNAGSGGISDGSMGACFGAQLGLIFRGC